MTFANNLDPDEAPQHVGPHLRSQLFDTQILYQQNVGLKQ